VAAAVLAVALAGCGIAKDPLGVTLGDASSAASSAALALEQHDDGRLTKAAAATMVDDARTELATAGKQLAELSTSGEQTAVQRDALDVLARSVQHVHEASADLGSSRARDLIDRLRADADDLERLEQAAVDAR